MKKATSAAAVLLIAVLIVAILPGMSKAEGYANYEKAIDLKILGLLSGSSGGLNLGSVPTRAEGAVMLVRLLGRESQAQQSGYSHPFKDVPAWADRYVGYMYRNGFTSGVGNGVFGSGEPLSALQYMTFVLRALGYDDTGGDFEYRDALDKAVKIGLLSADDASVLKSKGTFLRDDLVGISYSALTVKLKASSRTLLDKLILDDKAVYGPAATVLGLYTSELKSEIGNIDKYSPSATKYGYTANSGNDLFLIMRKLLYQNQRQFSIDIRNYEGRIRDDFSAAYGRAYNAVVAYTGVDDFISSWKYSSDGSTLAAEMSYRCTKEDFDSKREKQSKAVSKARQVVSSLIADGMPDYDKEKLLHDYIVNNTRYDTENHASETLQDDAFTAYGCLLQGIAVCQGYSEAMKLMCDLSGVECRVATGESVSSGTWEGHAWNLVRVDGDWYHLDVTFDDPVIKSGEKMLTYNYFNLTDREMGMINRWEKSDYPACTSVRENYYYRNKLIAGSREELSRAVRSALEQRKTRVEIKIENYTDEKYTDLPEIIYASGNVSGFTRIVDKKLGIICIYDIKYI